MAKPLKLKERVLVATETHWNPASSGFVTLGKVSEKTVDNEALPENTVSESRKDFCLKLIAVLSMPLEGIFFFGILIGWPNLAELYKESGVYESVCDKYATNVTLHGTINCPESEGNTYRIDFGSWPVWDDLIEIRKFRLIFSSSGSWISSERDVIFSAVGTLGSVTYNCMALPLGFILDKYGTFKARSIGPCHWIQA